MNTPTSRAATKRLLALTAADLMTTPVMTIPHEIPLRDAARLLTGSHMSGAPVVDAAGRCVGILSSSDFVTWAGQDGTSATEEKAVTCFIAPWGEMIDIDDTPSAEIRHYMTAKPITASPRTPIGELAQKMVEAHIHRILVVAEKDKPRGIVTSTDILAALADAALAATPHHPD